MASARSKQSPFSYHLWPQYGRGYTFVSVIFSKVSLLAGVSLSIMCINLRIDTPAILSEVKLAFQRKIKRVQEEYDIPDDLILNFDQTPLAYICGSNRTMVFQGAHSIPVISKGKKQQKT